MSKGQHQQTNGHPKYSTRGQRLDSKLGKRISMRHLEALLRDPPHVKSVPLSSSAYSSPTSRLWGPGRRRSSSTSSGWMIKAASR